MTAPVQTSAESFYLRPAAGLRVLDLETREPLPEEGAQKPKTVYWLRRLRDGDVVEGQPPARLEAPATTKRERAGS